MKTNTLKQLLGLAILSVIVLTTSCQKSEKAKTSTTWTKTYRNVILGDQKNYQIGHFFKPKTGEVIAVESAQSQQNALAMVMYTEYGNGVLFTFPGNAYEATGFKDDLAQNRLFTQNPGGMNNWDQSNLNSGEIATAATLDRKMSNAEFETLATGNDWTAFDSKFKEYNGGDPNLFSITYAIPNLGDVYLVQLNSSVRAFVYVKNIVPVSANGGSIKFDIVIEGSKAFSTNDNANKLQPSKD